MTSLGLGILAITWYCQGSLHFILAVLMAYDGIWSWFWSAASWGLERWPSFQVLSCHLVSSLGRCQFRVFAYFCFLNCAICFLIFEFWKVFMFSGYKSLFRHLIIKCFLLVYDLLFHLVTIFWRTKFLVLMKSNYFFFIYRSCFWCLRTLNSQSQSFSYLPIIFFKKMYGFMFHI